MTQPILQLTISQTRPKIQYATVKSNKRIDVFFQKSDSSDVKSYYILRSENGGAYKILDTVINQSNAIKTYSFSDTIVNASANLYDYKLVAMDSCGMVSDTSTIHQPVLLNVSQVGCTPKLRLKWSLYSGWAPVKKYEIYRSVNGGPETRLITVSNRTNTLVDSNLNRNDTFCYRVLAYDAGSSFTSWSNQVCRQTFFPNASEVLTVSKISTSNTNGTVVIRWKTNNKANIAYNDLYVSRDGITFKLKGNKIPANIDTFALAGFNTMDSDYYFYLVTSDSCGQQSLRSIIHKTTNLTVSVGQLLHKLNWTPYKGFKIKKYKIERLESGQFKTIDSVPGTDTSSKEFPAPCNFVIRYRISALGYDSGQISWSDTMGRQAIDTVPSDAPVMTNATVLNGTSSKINFTGSDSMDTYKFAIQRSENGNWGTAGSILFTKPGLALSYIDSGINTVKNHYCYTVIALDSCLNASPSDTFCLIQLKGTAQDDADSLKWHPFKGYGIQKYSLLKYNSSGSWDTLINLSNKDTSWLHLPLPCSIPVTYKISANEAKGNRLTFSDSITLTPFDTINPPAPVLNYATVLPDQTVKLNWQWNTKSDVKFFEVWRSTNNALPTLIKTVIYDSIYIDKVPNPKTELYSYHVIAIDSCNMLNRSQPSHWDTLMTLKLHSLFCKKQVQINWTPYKGLPNGVTGYEIYRSMDGVNFSQITTLKASANAFIDTSVKVGIQYFYKIKALDSKSGYSSFSDTLATIPRIIPEADSAQMVYASVFKTDNKFGQIYVQWKRAPLNDTNARGYYLYSFDESNGKYVLLQDVTNLNDTTYIESGINTQTGMHKYFIITYNVCDKGINSNTHKTVLLKVSQGNLSEQLHWSNYLGVPVKQYSIYKSVDGGPVILLKNAGLDSGYIDSNVHCHHSYTYQIQAVLENGKITFSDSVTIKAFDTIGPITAPILHTTVIKTGTNIGKILLQWKPAKDKNLQGYNILRSTDGKSWQLIHQTPIPIYAYTSIPFTDSTIDTYDQSYYYKIQPQDSCGNQGPFTIYHKTICLKALAGNQFAQLHWNAYEGWPVKKYAIYRNNILIKTVGSDTLNFKDTSTVCGQEYQYQVVGFRDSVADTCTFIVGSAGDAMHCVSTSFSNTDSVRAFDHIAPQRVYIKTVTVSNPNKSTTITWTPSPSFDTKNNYIYRKSGRDGNLTFLDSTDQTIYIDSITKINQISLITGSDICYYIFAHDHCGNVSPGSNIGCIIILNAKNQPGYNDLNWNGYEHWYDGVQSYNVYKNEDNTGWNLIGTTTPGTIHNFTDKSLGDSTINYCYQVEAVENPGQYNQLSRSTVVCVHQDATVFIPNTFSHYQIDGLNDYFGPKGLHIKSYSMRIYNRWGELVYITNFGQPWNGTFRGKDALEGVYIYLITIEDYNGNESNFKGNVTILH